jgi:hypothetical protein
MSFHQFCENEICIVSTQTWYVSTLLNGVPLVGAMDFSDGESMPLEPGQWSPFPGESLPLGIFTFYLFGERYF